MRRKRQAVILFLTAVMAMGSSSPAVSAEELQSGADSETVVLEATELTSGEIECGELAGEAEITSIPIISQWQGTTEELWSWVYVEQEQKFTLDEAYAAVFKNHEIRWNWESAEGKPEPAVQLTPGADGASCIVTGVKGHTGEKGRLVAEIVDEAGRQIGRGRSGQIEVREPSCKYDLQSSLYVSQGWRGKKNLRMLGIPEDASHPYGEEKIPLDIVNVEVENPRILYVKGWGKGYVEVSGLAGGWTTTMMVTYKRLDGTLDTHNVWISIAGPEYWALIRSSNKIHPFVPQMKPGETIELKALVNYNKTDDETGDYTVTAFHDFYVDWVITEGEDAVTIQPDEEDRQKAYLTANKNADRCKARIEARILHLNEDGKEEEIWIGGGSQEIGISIDKRPYRYLKWEDEKYNYYVDAQLDTKFEGVIGKGYRDYYYVKNGTVATDINGLHFVTEGYKMGTSEEKVFSDTFCFFKKGKIDYDFEGLAEYNGEKFYVKDGKIVKDMNGLYLVSGEDDTTTTDDKFYFFSRGQVQSRYKGLALYDNEWFYLENGYLDINTNGVVDHDGGRFIVIVGRIAREANGLWQDMNDGKWYFAANGQVQTQYTGVVKYDGKLFYIVKGELAVDYKGTIEYKGAAYEVLNGQLHKK